MANLIILEGVSRTGKSTITKILSDKFGFRHISIKNKSPEFISNFPDFYHGMHVMLNEFIKTFPEETFILDRSFLSELVYSRAFNRKTHVTEDDFIFNMLTENNFLLVNLVTTHSEYLNRIPKDRKIYTFNEFDTQKELFRFYFNHYLASTNFPNSKQKNSQFLEIDTNKNTIDEVVQKIEKSLVKINILNTYTV